LVFYGATWLRQDCARPAAHDFLSKIIRPGFILPFEKESGLFGS